MILFISVHISNAIVPVRNFSYLFWCGWPLRVLLRLFMRQIFFYYGFSTEQTLSNATSETPKLRNKSNWQHEIQPMLKIKGACFLSIFYVVFFLPVSEFIRVDTEPPPNFCPSYARWQPHCWAAILDFPPSLSLSLMCQWSRAESRAGSHVHQLHPSSSGPGGRERMTGSREGADVLQELIRVHVHEGCHYSADRESCSWLAAY